VLAAREPAIPLEINIPWRNLGRPARNQVTLTLWMLRV
jgi:hypothetical protein